MPLPEPMPETELDYVRSAARLLDLPLDEARALRVAAHLGRTRKMLGGLLRTELPADLEIAEVYRPAPFPAVDPA